MPLETNRILTEGTASFILLEMVEEVTDDEINQVEERLIKGGFSSFRDSPLAEQKLFVVFDKLNDKERELIGKLSQNYLPGLHDIKTALLAYNLTLGKKSK